MLTNIERKEVRRQEANDDPLFAQEILEERAVYSPLGFPLMIETNSDDVLHAASASWSSFPRLFDREPVLLSIGVSESAGSLPQPPALRSRRHLFSIVSDADNFIVCDFSRGYHFGWISQSLAAARDFFRYYFLDVAVLTTIQQLYLAPVHGACIAHKGRGVVLCGQSLAGKSTLAYACARSGWTYITDDATFLVRSGTENLAVGNCKTIRFREDARRFFPEISELLPSVRPNGVARIEVGTHKLPISTAPSCVIKHVIFLDRSSRAPIGLSRISSKRALDWCSSFASYGEESIRAAQVDSYRKLLSGGVWELRYRSLEDALILLDQITAED